MIRFIVVAMGDQTETPSEQEVDDLRNLLAERIPFITFTKLSESVSRRLFWELYNEARRNAAGQ